MLKNIGNPRIRPLRSHIGRCIRCCGQINIRTAFSRLRVLYVEMLHGKPPSAPLRRDLRHQCPAPRPRCKESPRLCGRADGCRQPDAARLHSGDTRETFDQTERLPATIPTQERMHLVDHDEAQIAKELWNRRMPMQEERLK